MKFEYLNFAYTPFPITPSLEGEERSSGPNVSATIIPAGSPEEFPVSATDFCDWDWVSDTAAIASLTVAAPHNVYMLVVSAPPLLLPLPAPPLLWLNTMDPYGL